MTHVTCKNLDQIRNPTLGNGVWGDYGLPFSLQNGLLEVEKEKLKKN